MTAWCSNDLCKQESRDIPDGQQVAVWLDNTCFFLCKPCADQAEEDNHIVIGFDDGDYEYSIKDLTWE